MPAPRRTAITLAGAALLALLGWWALQAPPPEAPPASEPAAAHTAAAPAPPAATVVAAPPRQSVERVQLKSGRQVRIVRRAAFKLPVGTLGPLYRQLAEEAASGNAVSGYRLGLVLWECREVPEDPAALDAQIERLHQTRRAGGFDVDSPREEERRLRSRFSDCAGIPAAERQRYREHLQAAADAGVIEAQLALPLKLPPGEWCQFMAECTPAQRARQEQLQQEAIDYTGRAREAGSAAALWTFAAWYAEGEVLPRDDIEAYAHFAALDEIHEATHQPRRFGKLLKGMQKRLRPVDLDRAQARENQLLANPACCVITP